MFFGEFEVLAEIRGRYSCLKVANIGRRAADREAIRGIASLRRACVLEKNAVVRPVTKPLFF
jgi:hypothetical protein